MNKLQILSTIIKVSPPDYIYDRILESVGDRVKSPTIYLYAAVILVLIMVNIFSYNSLISDEFFILDLINSPISFIEYE